MLALAVVLALAPAPGAADPEKQALWTAIDDVRRSIALYEKILDAHADGRRKLRPFPRVLRQKRRHLARLVKLSQARGHGDPPVLWDPAQITAPADPRAACARAVDQELRNAAIYETALGLPLAARVARVMASLDRKVRDRHIPAFEACVRLGAMTI